MRSSISSRSFLKLLKAVYLICKFVLCLSWIFKLENNWSKVEIFYVGKLHFFENTKYFIPTITVNICAYRFCLKLEIFNSSTEFFFNYGPDISSPNINVEYRRIRCFSTMVSTKYEGYSKALLGNGTKIGKLKHQQIPLLIWPIGVVNFSVYDSGVPRCLYLWVIIVFTVVIF